MVTVDKLKELLKEGKVTVTFTKKDGSHRVMVCTTNKDLVTYKTPDITNKSTRKENPNQIRVYDLEKNGWRSFNYDSVTNVSFPELVGVDPVTKTISGILVLAGVLYVLSLVS